MFLEVLGLLIVYYLFDNFYWKRRKLPPGDLEIDYCGE